jgi:hypothetical protein
MYLKQTKSKLASVMAVFPIIRNATQSRAWCVLGGGGVGWVGGRLSECLVNRQAGRVANLGGEKIRPRKARKTGKLEGQAERNEEQFLPGIPEQ